MKDYSNHIAIVGAGISGLALGIILQRNKIPCVIFEKSEKINEYGAGISISPNGLAVLNNLDVLNDLKALSRRPESAIFFSNNNKINQISVNVLTTTRKSLYKVLLDKFQALNGEIHFSHEVEDVDNETKTLKFNNKKSIHVEHIIACDGIRSLCQKKFRLNLMSLNIVVIMSGEQYSHQTKLIYIFILVQIFMLSHIL